MREKVLGVEDIKEGLHTEFCAWGGGVLVGATNEKKEKKGRSPPVKRCLCEEMEENLD